MTDKTIDYSVTDEPTARVIGAAVALVKIFDGQYVPNLACTSAIQRLQAALLELDVKELT